MSRRSRTNNNKKKPRARSIGSGVRLEDIALVPAPHRDQLVVAYTDSSVSPPQIKVASVGASLSSIRQLIGSPLASDVLIRSVPGLYEPRTQLFTGSQDAANDDQVISDLIQTAESSSEGLSSFLDGNLDQVGCDWTRLPAGEIAVTDMRQEALAALRSHLGSCLESPDAEPVQSVQVETQLRALLRCHLNQAGDSDFNPNPNDDGATAILAINPNGFITGLWSPGRGLVRELGEPFDIAAAFPATSAGEPSDPQLAEEMLGVSIDHSISRLGGLIREAQATYGFAKVERIFYAASTEVSLDAREKLKSYAAAMGLPLICSDLPLEEAVAYGLILGGFETPIPTIDLATDLRSRADETRTLVVAAQHAGKQMQRAAALLMILAPMAIALAFVLGTYGVSKVSSNRLANAYKAEQVEAARLKRVQDERNSAVQNITWFQTVVNQIIDRRKGQNGIIRLFDELDARWPKDDATFYVKELTVSPIGAVEMKGLTKREESVTAFGHSLEFSSGLFTNIAPTIVSANPVVPGSPNQPAMPAGINSSQTPGIIAWTLKATYSPLGNPGTAQVNPAGAARTVPAPPAVAPGGAQ